MVGEAIKTARQKQGLSQEDLAARSGLSRTHISAVERGANVSIDVVEKLAAALEIKEIPLRNLRRLTVLGDSVDSDTVDLASVRRSAERIQREARLLLDALRASTDQSPKRVRQFPDIWEEGIPEDAPFELWDPEKEPKWYHVPLTAIAAAGEGAQEEVTDETVRVPAEMIPGKNQFVIRARGDSMIDFGINDGDYLLVERRRGGVAAHNEVIIAWVDAPRHTGLVVKRWHRKFGKKRLMSGNERYPPLELTEEDLFDLQGIVRKVMHVEKPRIEDLDKISG